MNNKRKRRKKGRIFTTLGLLLLLGAVGLTAYNYWDSNRAGEESAEVRDELLELINQAIAEKEAALDATPSPAQPQLEENEVLQGLDPDSEEYIEYEDWLLQQDLLEWQNKEMDISYIDGYGYIGVLEIPDLKISLPVMVDWSYRQLKKAPCRYSGSYYEDNLVICGHNYAKHFSPIKWIDMGTDVYFVTVEGEAYHYVVESIETLRPSQVEDMITGDDWDLTLFTCTTGGQTRCAVRCYRVKE